MLIFAVGAFGIYWLATLIFHMPFVGAFFLLPLLFCAAMFLFMDHGSSEDKKTGSAHQH